MPKNENREYRNMTMEVVRDENETEEELLSAMYLAREN